MATATLSSMGQITIPLEVRRKLGVSTGDRVEFVELDNGHFALMAAIKDVRTLKGIVPTPRRPVGLEELRRVIAKRGSGR